jgi:hypothetical protein
MQPASSLVPTYRRQPSSPSSDGSQHCAAIGLELTVLVSASVTHVLSGLAPLPPSSTSVGGKQSVGAAVVGALGAALGDAPGSGGNGGGAGGDGGDGGGGESAG